MPTFTRTQRINKGNFTICFIMPKLGRDITRKENVISISPIISFKYPKQNSQWNP